MKTYYFCPLVAILVFITLPFSVEAASVVTSTSVKTRPVCNRGKAFLLPSELASGMAVIKKEVAKNPDIKKQIPLSRFSNCLHITFANTQSDYVTLGTSIAAFLPQQSSLQDLRIIVNPKFANNGHVILGAALAHEITHAWQFIQQESFEKAVPEFASYMPVDCFGSEAQAFWTEMLYIKYLPESDAQDLQEVLRHKAGTAAVDHIQQLIDFASDHTKELQKNPIRFLYLHYVTTMPEYVEMCLAE